jgi:hypothetical protein
MNIIAVATGVISKVKLFCIVVKYLAPNKGKAMTLAKTEEENMK